MVEDPPHPISIFFIFSVHISENFVDLHLRDLVRDLMRLKKNIKREKDYEQ